ncbi:MAG: DNA-formamidopyrimidine glycosylase family protein [Planctomycetota bacterium]
MPELPDILAYQAALEDQFVGRTLKRIDLKSPFLVRTFEPDLYDCQGKPLASIDRLGKRFVWRFDGGPVVVIHLMIAGRFHVRKPGARPKSKADLAAWHFGPKAIEGGEIDDGEIESTLMLTEASPKHRASIHVMQAGADLAEFDRGGLDVLAASLEAFADRLTAENHTLKRALTDPRAFDGIGNAYSDEVLHAAGLSPIKWTSRLSDEEIERLYTACRQTLAEWTERLVGEARERFPEKVTAFRPEMAVHGKHGKPCPVCDTAVQRIRYADNETNYCPRCQTEGKLLADRSLSRLLKGDWPKTIEELEER